MQMAGADLRHSQFFKRRGSNPHNDKRRANWKAACVNSHTVPSHNGRSGKPIPPLIAHQPAHSSASGCDLMLIDRRSQSLCVHQLARLAINAHQQHAFAHHNHTPMKTEAAYGGESAPWFLAAEGRPDEQSGGAW